MFGTIFELSVISAPLARLVKGKLTPNLSHKVFHEKTQSRIQVLTAPNSA